MLQEFPLTGVVHLVRPVHRTAGNLEELREGIAVAEPACLFYHAVQYRLRAPGDDDLPPDDFCAWVHGVLQDRETAERLALARLQGAESPDAMRPALLAVLDAASPAARRARAAPEGGAFSFLAADSVAVPTGEAASDGAALLDALARADLNVWFHELIECAWFEGGPPWVVRWLRDRDETRPAAWLEEAARSGRSMGAMRRAVITRWRRGGLGRRVAEAARDTENARREAGRDVVARLVRRLHEDEPK